MESEFKEEKKNKLGGKQYTSTKMKYDIDDMENIPAFERNNVKIEQETFSKDSKISRYTLSDDDDQKAVLRENNPYLHDRPD
ncbi:MAG: hypothetical protein U9R54_04105 [Bacteroidota bacterium]|nr:hypothetical protein [Bacteroidota bacterium]